MRAEASAAAAAAEDGNVHSLFPTTAAGHYGTSFVVVFWVFVAFTTLTVFDLGTVVITHFGSQEDDGPLPPVAESAHARTATTLNNLLETAEGGIQATTESILKTLGDLQRMLERTQHAEDAVRATLESSIEANRKKQQATSVPTMSREEEDRSRAGLLQYFYSLEKLERLLASSLTVEKSLSTQELLAWRSRVLGPLVMMDKALLGGHSERHQKLKDIEVALVEVLTRWSQHFKHPSSESSTGSSSDLLMQTAQKMTEPIYHPVFADSALPHSTDEEGRKNHQEYNAA